MKILILGSGGREHALAWKLAQSTQISKIIVSPGNGGTCGVGGFGIFDENAQKISSFSFPKGLKGLNVENDAPFADLLSFVQSENIGLVVVGSEAFLEQGISDIMEKAGVPCFGPKKQAALLETSKSFAKDIMQSAGVSTPRYKVFTASQVSEVRDYISEHPHPLVIKADGLCAGKGVFISSSVSDSLETLDAFWDRRVFGDAAEKILIEEFVSGEELSVLAFTDGENIRLLPPLQDHKCLNEGDLGPNTGGMGVYAYPSFVTKAHLTQFEHDFFAPVLREMKKRGIVYRGLLYAGLIFSQGRFSTLEFNVRFGDPECQCVLPLLESDLFPLLLACAQGDLSKVDCHFSSDSAVNVVMVSGGYPHQYKKGCAISGLEQVKDSHIFHAGSEFLQGEWVSNGGRVLSLTALGKNIDEALKKVYSDIKKVHFKDCYYRRDIAHREQKRFLG